MSRGRRIAPGLYRLPAGGYLVRVSSGPRGARAHQRNAGTARKLSEAALGEHAHVPLTRDDLVTIAKYAREHTKTQGHAIVSTYHYLSSAHRRAGLTLPDPPAVHVIRRGRRVLSPDDWQRFVAALPEGSCERLAVLLGYVTGCRESELYALRRRDVDMETGAVIVVSRKVGGDPRIAYLGPRTLAVVKAWRPTDPPDAPLLTLGAGPLVTFSLRACLRAASKAAGLWPLITTLGWVRNQAATAAVERGEGIDVASRALGHAQVSTTRRHYDRAVMTDARRVFSASQEEAIFGPHQSHTEARGSQPTPRLRRGKKR